MKRVCFGRHCPFLVRFLRSLAFGFLSLRFLGLRLASLVICLGKLPHPLPSPLLPSLMLSGSRPGSRSWVGLRSSSPCRAGGLSSPKERPALVFLYPGEPSHSHSFFVFFLHVDISFLLFFLFISLSSSSFPLFPLFLIFQFFFIPLFFPVGACR